MRPWPPDRKSRSVSGGRGHRPPGVHETRPVSPGRLGGSQEPARTETVRRLGARGHPWGRRSSFRAPGPSRDSKMVPGPQPGRGPRGQPSPSESGHPGRQHLPGYPVLVLQSKRVLAAKPGVLPQEGRHHLPGRARSETLFRLLFLGHRTRADGPGGPGDLGPMA